MVAIRLDDYVPNRKLIYGEARTIIAANSSGDALAPSQLAEAAGNLRGSASPFLAARISLSFRPFFIVLFIAHPAPLVDRENDNVLVPGHVDASKNLNSLTSRR